jgi:CheY-like chemotaxis protein
MNVLIAEDVAVSRRILQLAVERHGHTCLVAANGAEAWTLFEHHDVDAVITD